MLEQWEFSAPSTSAGWPSRGASLENGSCLAAWGSGLSPGELEQCARLESCGQLSRGMRKKPRSRSGFKGCRRWALHRYRYYDRMDGTAVCGTERHVGPVCLPKLRAAGGSTSTLAAALLASGPGLWPRGPGGALRGVDGGLGGLLLGRPGGISRGRPCRGALPGHRRPGLFAQCGRLCGAFQPCGGRRLGVRLCSGGPRGF